MSATKSRMIKIIESQPEDANYNDILRELAFEKMVDEGLADVEAGRLVSEEEMEERIRSWQK